MLTFFLTPFFFTKEQNTERREVLQGMKQLGQWHGRAAGQQKAAQRCCEVQVAPPHFSQRAQKAHVKIAERMTFQLQ